MSLADLLQQREARRVADRADHTRWLRSLNAPMVPQPVRHDDDRLPPGLHACDACGVAVDIEADPDAIDPDDPQTVTCELDRRTWDTDEDWRDER